MNERCEWNGRTQEQYQERSELDREWVVFHSPTHGLFLPSELTALIAAQ